MEKKTPIHSLHYTHTLIYSRHYSLRTSLCLQVIPPCVAAVCLALSALYFDMPKPTSDINSDNEWYELLGLDLEIFKLVSHQIIEPLSAENQLKGLMEFESK